MNEYNDKWTRDKFIEYRKLKRSGYSHDMLKEYFGEDIYESGLYNKNAHVIPFDYYLKYKEHELNEIKLTPEYVDYWAIAKSSVFIKEKTDYLISFESNDVHYVICLMIFPINDIDTYNIVFTTKDQWDEYEFNLRKFFKKGFPSEEEFEILNQIISRETKLNDLFPIFRKIYWILLDFYNEHLKNNLLSIGDTDNKKKINLYRNIIKDSFTNITENETIFNNNRYYIYKIN